MTAFTKAQAARIAKGICPFCPSQQFYEGPSGGASVNYECAQCAARINIVPGTTWGETIREPVCTNCKRQRNAHTTDAKCLYSSGHWSGPALFELPPEPTWWQRFIQRFWSKES